MTSDDPVHHNSNKENRSHLRDCRDPEFESSFYTDLDRRSSLPILNSATMDSPEMARSASCYSQMNGKLFTSLKLNGLQLSHVSADHAS